MAGPVCMSVCIRLSVQLLYASTRSKGKRFLKRMKHYMRVESSCCSPMSSFNLCSCILFALYRCLSSVAGSQLWQLVKARRDEARDVTCPPCAHLW
ncbi:hypothetical protein EDD22DRAFT_461065 [Suillus occidentalis]|nr:hypothetical protein EDD22DRAFT_461065 [Suillus occidentalis]